MVDWQYNSKDSAQLLGRILDCGYPKEQYVVVISTIDNDRQLCEKYVVVQPCLGILVYSANYE